MAISIATTYQNLVSSSADIDSSVNVPTGTTLMACVTHPRDVPITTITWDSVNFTPWVTYNSLNYGWKALSIFALPNFTVGNKIFTCSTGGSSEKFVSLFSWNGLGYFYNVNQGMASPGGSAYVSKTVLKNSETDLAFMLCNSAEGGITSYSGTLACLYSTKMLGQHGPNTGLSTSLVTYTNGDDLHVTWITLALQEYVAPPPTELFSPMWFF